MMAGIKQTTMRKLVMLLFIQSCMLEAFAQVQIQTTLPAVGLVQKNQLWNLVVTNGTGSGMQGRIDLVLLYRQTAQEIMTASSTEFTLDKGAKMISVNTLSPIVYNYIGTEPDKNFNTLLPVGAYTVCYSFIGNPGTPKSEVVTEECTDFDVEPLSPPMLTFPADSSVLETQPGQFTWMPPTPAAMLNRLHYELLITEIEPSQMAAEAVEENAPFFGTESLQTNFMTYSGAQMAFEKDKWYAWQVIAKDDNNYAGKSEVWVFRVKNPGPAKPKMDASPFIRLQKNGAEKSMADNNILRFYYFNQLGDSSAKVTISDLSEKTRQDDRSFSLSLARGDNYIQKDISKYVKVQEGHLYMLSLQNSAMEKWHIMFEIRKNNK